MAQEQSPDRSPLRVGTVLQGSFEIIGPIGAGGFGSVWAAKHIRLGNTVAVKILHQNEGAAAADQEAFQRFVREARVASSVDHPNIVKVLDFNQLPDGTWYILMEYFKGESLRERLRQGPMSLGPALDVIRQLGDALGAIHRIGVVHRDLKPDNVFLCPTVIEGKVRDVVKLIDFGIAKTADSDLTAVGVCFGTLSYMSPEQLRGEGDAIDQRTDVFAFGAVVYEMLTGEKAFPGSRDVVVQRILYGAPAPLSQRVPSLSAQVVEAVERALEKDRTKRLPDVASFVEALAARGAVSPSPTPNAPTPPGPGEGLPTQATVAPIPPTAATFLPTAMTVPPPESYPRKWALAVVPAVALLASVAWSVIGHDKPDPLPHSQVEVELRLADAALREGRVWDAIDIATRTLEDEKTDRAFAIIARSYCKQGDVASAKAELEKIPAAQRQAILNDCEAAGSTARR